jgi:hypothetical protein
MSRLADEAELLPDQHEYTMTPEPELGVQPRAKNDEFI